MTSERWQEIEAVLQGVLDRPLAERASFLDDACAGDEQLKREAVSLISAHDEAGDFIEQPAIAEDARVIVGALDRQIGRDIGAYTILERLGAGGMGEVYLAHDRRLNRSVALKILPAFFAADDMRLRRFQREAQAASALNHPNILTIHEVGEHEDTRFHEDIHFIATEFIEGQTIRELIAHGRLSTAEILDIAEQVASALSAAHAAGIVHRDIKPENIMRRADGLVKILDFGIVKLMEQPSDGFSTEATSITQAHTEVGVVMGTAGYMSPEQARGLPVDERTDIWSLGVVLYEMLAHRAPFSGPTRMDTMVAILEREPPPLFSSGEHAFAELVKLSQIVEKTLSKESNERYQTAMELAAALKSVRNDLAPLFEKESVDSLREPGTQNLSEPHLAQPPSQQLDKRFISPPVRAALTGPTLSAPSLSASVVQHNAQRRKALWVGSVAILLTAVLAGTFLYRRAPTPLRDSTTARTATAASVRLYVGMSEAEQFAFIRDQEQRISAMMGDRPAKLNEEARRAIKAQVDRYVRKRSPGEASLSAVYARAPPYIPLIARSFAAHKVPVIIGIYLPMIESAYQPCAESSLGSRGLFQFLPETARNYGVSREEMCDAEKMAPAAAAYIADHMAELGDDAESMTLVLLSYNRGATSVRHTLRELRDLENYQRNFWTLFAHRDKLDDSFRNESAAYVPAFIAAAIIGENPETFEIQMPPLSSLAAGAEK